MSSNVFNGIKSRGKLAGSNLWFADSRICLEWRDGYMEKIAYFGKKGMSWRMFQADEYKILKECFRPLIKKDNYLYNWPYDQTETWPFGFWTRGYLTGTSIEVNCSLTLIEDSLIFYVKPNPYVQEILLVFSNDSCREGEHGYERHWSDWQWDKEHNILMSCAWDRTVSNEDKISKPDEQLHATGIKYRHADNRTWVAVAGDGESLWTIHRWRHVLSQDLRNGHHWYVVFSSTRKDCYKRIAELRNSANQAIFRKRKQYQDLAQILPTLEHKDKRLSRFFVLAPLYRQSATLSQPKGVSRASTKWDYWIWGWDGLNYPESLLFCGQNAQIQGLLDYYCRTASPDTGVGHQFSLDHKVALRNPDAAQGIYTNVLWHGFNFSKDKLLLSRYYPFVRSLLRRVIKTLDKNTGLSRGFSLFPDFPESLEENDNSLSTFNNLLVYTTLRQTENLAVAYGDQATAEQTRKASMRMEQSFLPVLFDERIGFLASSADSKTMKRRTHYLARGVWNSAYLVELLEPVIQQLANFIEKHITISGGFRFLPIWDSAYDADGNQFHCWWPFCDNFILKILSYANRYEVVNKWIQWLGSCTEQITLPEAVHCFTERGNLGRIPDMGNWQTSHTKGWHSAVILGLAGVEIDVGGFTVVPFDGDLLTISNLCYRGSKVTIKTDGQGKFIEEIILGDKKIQGTAKIPWGFVSKSKTINLKIRRSMCPNTRPFLLSAHGAVLHNVISQRDSIKLYLSGFGRCRLRFQLTKPMIAQTDKSRQMLKFSKSGVAQMEVVLHPEKKMQIYLFPV